MAKTHRMPYFLSGFPAKEPFLYLVALLWKKTCNLRHPMHLCHSVRVQYMVRGLGSHSDQIGNVCTPTQKTQCAHVFVCGWCVGGSVFVICSFDFCRNCC